MQEHGQRIEKKGSERPERRKLRKEGRRERDRADEGGREGARTRDKAAEGKKGSAPRTKLKSRECNSSDLKTMIF